MSKYDFPIGAMITREGMPICTYLGDSRCLPPNCGTWTMCDAGWVLVHPDVQPEPAHESDWSYAEAERLQKLAHEAIDTYNEYINAKPNTVFLTIFK